MGSGLEHAHEKWLDLVADMVGRPLIGWPAPEILSLLAASFEAPAAVFYTQEGAEPIEQVSAPADLYGGYRAEVERWSAENAFREHPLLRFYLATGRCEVMQVADVPERFAGRRVQERWRVVCDDLLGADVVSQVSMPLRLGPRTNRSFLVGRCDAYAAEEMALLGRVQRVLIGLDRQIAAHARWSARTGAHAIPVAGEVGLTPRESAVLDLLAAGGTARAIARRLAVGERTVQKHLQRIYTKLGVADRLAAVQRAQLIGLLPPPGLVRT
ncbi:helix-turn-helix transcriptional regulator [Actinomycetospora sp. C-140]